jgi:hypothetical protein
MGCGLSVSSRRRGGKVAAIRDASRGDANLAEVCKDSDEIQIRLDQEDLVTDCHSSVSGLTSLHSMRPQPSRGSRSTGAGAPIDDSESLVPDLNESIADLAELHDLGCSGSWKCLAETHSGALSPRSSPFPGGERSAPTPFIDTRPHPLAPAFQSSGAQSSLDSQACPTPLSGDLGMSSEALSVRDDLSCASRPASLAASIAASSLMRDDSSVVSAPPEMNSILPGAYYAMRSSNSGSGGRGRRHKGDQKVRSQVKARLHVTEANCA